MKTKSKSWIKLETILETYDVSFNNVSQDTKEERAKFSIFDSDDDGEEDSIKDEIDNFLLLRYGQIRYAKMRSIGGKEKDSTSTQS